MLYHSEVPDHKGLCEPTWLNTNQVFNRLDGGISGFFKNVVKGKHLPFYFKEGEEFHGVIKNGVVVKSK